MITAIYIVSGFVGLALVASFAWRFASRRFLLPCPTYAAWMLENPLIDGLNAHTTIERLDLQSGMNVLDIGCGPGRLTIPIAQKVAPHGQVVAIDVQQGMLSRAQSKARAANVDNIRFVLAGAGAGELEANYYDRAALVTVLGEIPDRQGALREIFDALKPGGVLSVTEIFPDVHFQTRDKVRELARRAGFREKESFGKPLSFTLNLEKPRDTS